MITGEHSWLVRAAVCLFILVTCGIASAQTTQTSSRPSDLSKQKTLYMVGYAHLDTQWRWSYPQVIAEFVRKTMEDNFKLFDKYPHYIFNFTGANRYMMMKEFFPEDYQKVKQYVAQGKWFPAGSSMEEGDANMPSGEALIRQVLYGNEFFRREFHEESSEFMLPDCFGFQACLPSILAHCGLKGFSTQKLTWGSAVGIPFNVGVWKGPDGRGVVAALNPLSYTTDVTDDLSYSPYWLLRMQEDVRQCGVGVDYGYYGTGDRGGAPSEESVSWMEKSVAGDGPIHVVSARSDQMFNDLTARQIAKLPTYQGDLLLTNHSAGSLSSEAYVKRLNRKIEQLAAAAEGSSVIADWLGAASYPREKLASAWRLLLGAHFHDTMAGTMIPKAYEYTWNNLTIALNQFAAVTEDASGGVIAGMDTQSQGVPVVVYNSLSIDRQDVADVTVEFPQDSAATIVVFGSDGKEVPSQVLSSDAKTAHILFLASVPSAGYAVYDVRSAATAPPLSELKVTPNSLENSRFLVQINSNGDIRSIFDKKNLREVLSAPARLVFRHEKPAQYPAWNMDWKDRITPPVGFVDGPAEVRVTESGPARVCLEITRRAQGSKFVQDIRLSAGDAGDRVEVDSRIDWQTQKSSLRAEFPLTVSNPNAVYESQSAAVERGNNNPKKFETPQQKWFDLDATDKSYGVGILNDCKYGSDKPADNVVRLTLLYTPQAESNFQDQATQDIGHHEMIYAIAPHGGSWQSGQVPWLGARINQPIIAFQTSPHTGVLGRAFSMVRSSSARVGVIALKKAEEDDRIIVRVNELTGNDARGVELHFAGRVLSADEMDGQEREIAPANVRDGQLIFDIQPFGLRTFAVRLEEPEQRLSAPVCQPVALDFNLDGVSSHLKPGNGDFDGKGHTYPKENWPEILTDGDISFRLGSTGEGEKNAIACDGRQISIPAGSEKIYLLASAVDGDLSAKFLIDDQPSLLTIQNWTGHIGQWDNRLWDGVIPELTYDWHYKFAGLVPGFIKRDAVAWFSSYRHDVKAGNEYYRFCYLFKYGIDVAAGTRMLTLPNDPRIRIFAMTAARSVHDGVRPAAPLYDTLENRGSQDPPSISPPGGSFNDSTPVTIGHPLYWREGGLHYTTDGTEPTAASPSYTGKLLLASKCVLRAREFLGDGVAGPETRATFDVDDTTPPTVKSVEIVEGLAQATIVFSEPVEKASATSPKNYRFDPPMEVKSAALSEDGLTVTLSFFAPLKQPHYRLTVNGVMDISPRANVIVGKTMGVMAASEVYYAYALDFPADARSIAARDLPVRAQDPWTMNMFVRSDEMPGGRTIIAGFGKCDDAEDGTGRYLTVIDRRIRFWSRNQDVRTSTPFAAGVWQMITLRCDGERLTIFKDGQQIAQGSVALSDDDSTIHFGPIDPWDKQYRFAGRVNQFSIWKSALSSEAIAALAAEEKGMQ